MKNVSKLLISLGLVPFFIYLIFIITLNVEINFFSVATIIVLFLGGYGIGILNKKINTASLILNSIICVTFFISGLLNEKFFLLETILSIILASYYGALHYANYYMVKTKNYRNELNEYFKKK